MRKRLLLLAGACVAVATIPAAHAEEPFVDTRAMARHAGQILPSLIAWENALSGKTSFLYREENMSFYEPGWDKVTAARKPFAAMAGVSEASTFTAASRLQAAGDDWAAGAGLRSEVSHSYRDGAGTKVDAGFERETEWLGARWGKPTGTLMTIGVANDTMSDAKLRNYGLDLDSLYQGGARMTLQSVTLPGWFNQAGGLVGWSYAHVDADNFSLRRPIAFRIRGEGDHDIMRANGWAAHDTGTSRTLFGTELQRGLHSAKRYGHEYSPSTVTAYWVPGVEILRASTWAEHTVKLDQTKLQAGLRYDAVGMSAADIHMRPNTPSTTLGYNYSPQQLYERYYGPGIDNDKLDHNVSGRLRAEQTLDSGRTIFGDLSRMVRSPEFTERYNGNGGPGAIAEVGNPNLVPEKHYKAELGGEASGGGFVRYGEDSPPGSWKIRASVWHDQVDDFVVIDSARGQAGVLRSDGALVYRNVDAAISGISAEAMTNLAPALAMRLTVTGQRGRNLTDSRPLHQIPALEANLSLDTFGGDADFGWNAGTRLRAVVGKHAVDASKSTGSGQDTAGEAGGFATLDVYAGLRVGDIVAVTMGVDNVFDKLYREHLKTTPETSTGIMPNAPGRTFVLRTLVAF